ncbi:hypothetical protein [Micromonospora sp. LOL_021]|uniref:hypothetical protein n=1 Tax=Micromonospora sp. LOL_021 TaxID=3345417 RepID=UPI003A85DF51
MRRIWSRFSTTEKIGVLAILATLVVGAVTATATIIAPIVEGIIKGSNPEVDGDPSPQPSLLHTPAPTIEPFFSGTVLITENGTDLDSYPPMYVGLNNDLFASAGAIDASYYAKIAIWDGEQDATRAECAKALNDVDEAKSRTILDPEPGTGFCVLTGDQRNPRYAFGIVEVITQQGFRTKIVIW